MKWTSEPPIEPGYYWVKDEFNIHARPEIVQLGLYPIPVKEYSRPITEKKNLSWAGPIPEPEEE